MVRWYVTAQDSNGLTGRFPVFARPNTDEEYKGTIVEDEPVDSQLPVFHMFVERFSRATTATGSPGAMFYDGEFYDNVQFNLHGQSSSGFPTQKKSLNVDFPNDHRLRLRDDLPRMEDINLLTNFADKSKMRNTLAYDQLAMTGGAYHLAFPVRLHQNGEFYAVYDFVEDADERWLERLGYDPNNSLYKIYNTFGTAAGAEKKTREFETNRDLSEFITGIRQSGAASVDYIMDNVNLAEMANFLAGFVLTSNTDCCHKNYYAYRDTEGTGEWWFFPWDNDLTQGRVWGGFGLAYFDDTMYPRNPLFMASNNELVSRLYSQVPGFRDMYLRRVRTLIDEYYKKPGTPADQLPFETRVAELYEMLKPDADLDNQNHRATWGQTGFQTFEQAVQIMLNEYIKPRREFLYFEQVVPDDTDVTVLLSGEPGATSGRYFVPTDESLGRNWTQPDFDDSSWREGPMGIGFEIGTNNYTDLITTDLGQELEGRTSLYARVPFDVADPSSVSALTLRMKYEDGFVAYLNGVEIAREGLREDQPTFDSTSRSRSSRLATEYQNINITSHLDKLVPGRNILAIQGLNASATSNDLFFLPEIVDGIISNSRGEVPRAQVGNPMIEFGGLDFNPTSGNQQQEYLTLVNNNDFSVDISHWQLTGDVEKTFDPGTVLIPGGTLYVTPDARAFRARSEGPTGGMRLFVQGNYDGYLPNVGGSVQLVARDGQAVSLLTYDGTTSSLQEHLRISELMYNPMEASATELAVDNSLVSDDFEFIELVNTSATETLSLSDVRLANGVQFDFTGAAVSQLEPGQRVLIVRNATAFALRYGNDVMDRVAGEFAANTALRDTGERVTLTTFDGSIIVDFEYSDLAHQGWPNRADGSGSSLVIVDPHGDYQSPQNWRASSEIHGSPGATEAAPIGGIVINELLTRPAAGGQDQIELYNPTSAAITLTNYFLSDSSASRATLAKFAIPATTIPAGGFLVLSESEFNAENAPNGFGLSGTNGEQLYLTVGDASGPTHFVDAVWFDGSVQGESFARIPDATGRLYPAVSQTFGSINSGPRVGPLVISELMINPGTPSAAALALNPALTEGDADLEYLEIHNPTASVVDLTEWRIRLGVDFDFDAGTQIGAGQTLLVLSFNPTNPANAARLAAFRAHYGLNENVQLIGNFAGQLSDQGEGVRLVRPGAAAPDDPTNIPRLLEDQVHYDDVTPWPVDAFTGGMSLTRLASNAFGDAATGWTAASPSPGTFGGELAGDLNGDGRLDADDVNRLQQAALTGDLTADLTGDGLLNEDDMVYLVENLMGTSIGDVNFDGVFNSRDLVLLFIAGQFEDGATRNSTYTSGDWNLDGEFTTDDLSFALRRGGYVPVAAAQARDAVFAEPPAAIAAAIEDEDDQQVDERWSGLEL
jgi:hypothetical protein